MSATASSVAPASFSRESGGQAYEDEIQRIFDLHRAAALRLRTSTVAQRIAKLKRLRTVLLEHRQAVVEAGMKDFRRPATEVEMTELMPILMDISDACYNLKKWLKPRKVRPTGMMLGTSAWTRYEPRGRCLIIAPWKDTGDADAWSAGPRHRLWQHGDGQDLGSRAAFLHRAGADHPPKAFPEEEVAVFEGDDAAVATALLALPFDHCFFTGAPAIGKVVMRAATRSI